MRFINRKIDTFFFNFDNRKIRKKNRNFKKISTKLKSFLQYQIRNKKINHIYDLAITYDVTSLFLLKGFLHI